MNSAIIELHFFPSIEYFCALHPFDHIVAERHEHFVKQSYRNRCHILGANRPERLTLPLTHRHGKLTVDNVQIDTDDRWRNNIWRTITSAYAKAPYFEHFADDVRGVIFAKTKFLYDMNLQILSLCLKWLRLEKKVSETGRYEMPASEGLVDLRNVISSKKDFRQRSYYAEHPYQQVFGNRFVPNLSIIDLVFCEGPGAAARVEGSMKRK